MDDATLLSKAEQAAEHAYAIYSKFRVGCALLCADGTVICGVNVENRSYGLTNCAERTAIYTALTMGKKEFTKVAVFAADSVDPIPPCGACRQVLSEFMSGKTEILMGGTSGAIKRMELGDLYPNDSLHGLNQ